MSLHTLTLTLKRTRMGWCLFVNGMPYAVGSQAYCISVANELRSCKGGAA
jgi:hypothetical protein